MKYVKNYIITLMTMTITLLSMGNLFADPQYDYYATLEIEPKASKNEIRNAYKIASRTLHPDRIQQQITPLLEGNSISKAHYNALLEQAGEYFKAISESYTTLTDDNERRMYDTYYYDSLIGKVPLKPIIPEAKSEPRPQPQPQPAPKPAPAPNKPAPKPTASANGKPTPGNPITLNLEGKLTITDLSSAIPSDQKHRVTTLNLRANAITQITPELNAFIGRFSNLETLLLGDNPLIGFPDNFLAKNPKVKVIGLARCKFTDFPEPLKGRLNQLTFVNLIENPILPATRASWSNEMKKVTTPQPQQKK